MDKLRGMETFIAVVESGSFTGAAARLEMSAVMVGKYITQLESQLGTRLPGVEGEVRWKRDAVLRCNDGYGLRMAARAGAGLLLQPEVLVVEELASGRLVRVLEAFTPAPRPVHLLWRQDLRPLPKLTEFIAHILLRLGTI